MSDENSIPAKNDTAVSSPTIPVHFSLTSSPSSPRLSTSIPKDIKASEFRKLASRETKIPLESLKLIFRGRVIQNDDKELVVSYNVEENSVIHCLGKPQPQATATGTSTTTGRASGNEASSVGTSAAVAGVPAVPPKLTLEAALQKLLSKNQRDIYEKALNTLLKIVGNILDNPNDEKYRRLKPGNATFARRVGNLEGGLEAVECIGFKKKAMIKEGEETILELPAEASAWDLLVRSKNILQSKLNEAKIMQQQQSWSSDFGQPRSGGFGGGAGGFPMMPSGTDMQNQIANLMQNPTALQEMLQNPMVRQMMENDPRLANNPMMRQALNDPNMIQRITQAMSDPSVRQMMNNPDFLRSMMPPGGGGLGGFPPALAPPMSGTGAPSAGVGAGAGGIEPNAFARMMQGFQPPQTSNTMPSNNNSAAPSSNGSSTGEAGGGVGEREMTEEEMIAEAIARSLRET